MKEEVGRAPAGQALVATLPEPVPVSALAGDDPSRVDQALRRFGDATRLGARLRPDKSATLGAGLSDNTKSSLLLWGLATDEWRPLSALNLPYAPCVGIAKALRRAGKIESQYSERHGRLVYRLAQAIDARSAMTAGHGPKDESAVLKEDAPEPCSLTPEEWRLAEG